MGSPIKIKSISIDLAEAANDVESAKCNHFSLRKFVAERREKDPKKSWPFSEESAALLDKPNYSLPSLSVPNSRWWRCLSCIKDIDVDSKDCGHSMTSQQKLDGIASLFRNKSKMNSLTIIDHEKENITDGNAVEENVNVNGETSQKNDQTAKKVHQPRSTDASTVRSKSRKVASPEKVGSKRSKEKANKSLMDISSLMEKQIVDHQAVTTFGSSEIAGVLEDTPPKAIKNRKGSRVLTETDTMSSESIKQAMMSGLPRRKTRRSRLLSELLGNADTEASGGGTTEDPSGSKRESVRGRKRKFDESNYASRLLSTIGATSENGSDHGDFSESTDSGFDRDRIKGKQRNRRFQVVDELLPSSLPCETSQERINENDADPAPKIALPGPMQSLANGIEKKLSLTKKKRKNKPVTDNVKKSTLISFGTGVEEGNQVKPRTGPSNNVISKSTRDLLLSDKRVFDNRLASEGYFRKYNPQLINDKPGISLHLQGGDHVRRSRDAEAPPSLRDFGSSSKSNTGGWLRSGADVVDFSSSSNNNTNRSSFQNFNSRHTPSSTEVADLSSLLRKDASGADRKGKKVMVQEPSRKENTPEDGNDDIPMEIVELMAKNQYERCLPDKEDDVSNKETPHKSKNALLIDLNETYDNGISMEDNNASRQQQQQQQPCGSNARKEDHYPMGMQQQKSHDFFPVTQPPYVPSFPFGIFPPPTQDNRANTIRFSGHNCQWLGNVPTMPNQNPSPSSYRVLRACNTCQSIPPQYGEAYRPIWPSSMIPPPPPQGHQKPVSFNMDQQPKSGMLPQAPNNENTWNLNFNGKQKSGPNSEFSFGCKHAAAAATGASSSRSIDAFSNESSIPALHLLSLMDHQVKVTTPADHHGNNAKFTKRHFPPANNQSIELQTGDSSKTPFSSNQLPFDLYRKRLAPETSRRSYPMIAPMGTSSLSFQNGQASWNQQKNKRKETFAPPVYSSQEKQVFANSSSSSDQGKFQLLGASNSMMLPLKFHITEKEKKQKRKAESSHNNASAWPSKSGSGPVECIVNRNPADFTIPEPGNIYMVKAESLKVRKRAVFKKKPSLCKQDALKQTKKPVCPPTENA